MKRLFLFFFLLLSSPFHTYAISLHELQDNPQQYQMVDQDSEYTNFVDSGSIESLRYSPPYYTLKCTSYFVDYLYNVIGSFTINISYDISYRDFNSNKRKISDLGIYISNHLEDRWSLNGNYHLYKPESDNSDCGINSPAYHVANYLFYKAYDEYYGPRFGNTLY